MSEHLDNLTYEALDRLAETQRAFFVDSERNIVPCFPALAALEAAELGALEAFLEAHGNATREEHKRPRIAAVLMEFLACVRAETRERGIDKPLPGESEAIH